jgi:hypothetical protein
MNDHFNTCYIIPCDLTLKMNFKMKVKGPTFMTVNKTSKILPNCHRWHDLFILTFAHFMCLFCASFLAVFTKNISMFFRDAVEKNKSGHSDLCTLYVLFRHDKNQGGRLVHVYNILCIIICRVEMISDFWKSINRSNKSFKVD